MNAIIDKVLSLPSLRTTVDAHQLMANKSLGQNFLLDQNITDKIIRTSLAEQHLTSFCGHNIYEIGPGPGGLTRAILKANPAKLTTIEMDKRCINIIEELKEKTGDIIDIFQGDALEYSFISEQNTSTHIISNLPYNISVPLLIKWLYQIADFKSLTLMFQKEVADRIMAPTHNKHYGRISILAQLQCKITKLMDLSPENFIPAPKIWSSVLLFQPLDIVLTKEQIKKIEKITSQAFSARRKMIRQSLKSFPNLNNVCEKLQIPLTARPEELSPQQFLTLSENLVC